MVCNLDNPFERWHIGMQFEQTILRCAFFFSDPKVEVQPKNVYEYFGYLSKANEVLTIRRLIITSYTLYFISF